MQNFPLREYKDHLQLTFLTSELQKYFTTTCPSEDLLEDYLNITTIIPKAYPLAEAMALELYKGFSQHFLRNPSAKVDEMKKFSKQSSKEMKFKNFVADFIEDENGIIYFLQVKAIEFEHVEQL